MKDRTKRRRNLKGINELICFYLQKSTTSNAELRTDQNQTEKTVLGEDQFAYMKS